MTREEAFEKTKKEIIGDDLTITTALEADQLHEQFIKLRTELFFSGITEIMPHYRGEQNFGWDIRSGIFRPPLKITDPKVGKDLEQKAIQEFEKVINEKVGAKTLRDLFYNEKHGKDWDLLFQAQHAGIKTTLTDWSAFIISALFFATEQSADENIEKADGQLWCFLIPTINILGHNNYPERNTFYDINPFEITSTFLINPSSYISEIEERIFEYRMYRQKGRFVMVSNDNCHIPLNQQEELKKYILRAKIPAEFKSTIRQELANRGITRETMYIDETPSRQDLITEINVNIFNGF